MSRKIIARYTSVGGIKIVLREDRFSHAKNGHPEVTEEKIREAIESPKLVCISNSNTMTSLFYKDKKNNFFSVVVKKGQVENQVWTAYETTKIKKGKQIYP